MVTSYHSTRNKGIQAGAREAVLTGIASDGGLFVRPDLGTEKADLDRILNQSYQENAAYILGLLLPDYTEEELKQAVAAAYTGTFADKAITPLKPVGDLHVLELFHGPTSAFKDVALTMLPQLMSIALQDTEDSAMILTATSGDTGKAALSGFRDVDRTGIAVFYPDGKVSQIQYRQMATQQGSNVKVFAVRGNFDDAQSAVKQLFLDEDLGQWAARQNIRLSSANSINVGRLVPQVVYYFEAWKQLVNQGVIGREDKVSFSVPTGNFGDVLAGYYAYRLGLPVKKFVVASNANNVLTEFITTGVYDRNRPFVKTISPSMDILISSNLERLLYYMTDGNTEQVAAWMQELAETGRYEVTPEVLERIRSLFEADYADDAATKETIADAYKEERYVLDPHSAIGYRAGLAKKDDTPMVVLATASPYKFAQDVMQALTGEELGEWDALHRLQELCQDPIPAGLAALENAKILHEAVIGVPGMKEAVQGACSLVKNGETA